MSEWLLLLLASGFAGALNAVAGGGKLFVFPALLFAGVPPIAANALCTIVLWPAALASIAGYRAQLACSIKTLGWMLPIAVIGGWLGAEWLLSIQEKTFTQMIPWLLLAATCMFQFGKRITARIASRFEHHQGYSMARTGLAASLLFATAVYGGFFGAGIGILILAILYIFDMEDIHQMNALKTVMTSGIHVAALITFVASGIIVWEYAFAMIPAAILGGYAGARLALRTPVQYVRRFVLTIAWGSTCYFFYTL